MKAPKLYQVLTTKRLGRFLSTLGTSLEQIPVVEIKTDTMYGDFIVTHGYYFKLTYGNYQCMQTPEEKHQPQKANILKNPKDSINYK